MSLSFNKISGPLKTGAPTQSPRKTPSLGEFLQPPPQPPSQAHSYRHPDGHDDGGGNNRWQHLYVLPVLLLEFLALALTRAALPSMLVNQYGDSVYVVMGMADCIRGLLAFVACPLFGKISDMIGRRVCLFITGTSAARNGYSSSSSSPTHPPSSSSDSPPASSSRLRLSVP